MPPPSKKFKNNNNSNNSNISPSYKPDEINEYGVPKIADDDDENANKLM